METKNYLNYITRAAFVAAGLLCVFHAPSITKWFPYLIGITMMFSGMSMFIDHYPLLMAEKGEKHSSRVTRSILLVLLGIVILLRQRDAMPFIGVVWGILGLLKGGRGITYVLCGSLHEKGVRLTLLKAIVAVILSFILLFNPVDAVGKHIIILGLQLINYGVFKMDSEEHPKKAVKKLHERVDSFAEINHKNRE